MHLATLLSLTDDYCRIAQSLLAVTGNPAPLVPVDPLAGPPNSPWDFNTWRGNMELVSGGFCLLSSLGLACYFTYSHHQIRSSAPKGLRKKSLWTVDQINACLITFGMAVMFLLIHYSWQ